MTNSSSSFSELQLRKPREEDGKAIWQLVKDTGVLDLNSPYSYLILCKYFKDTCVVVEEKNGNKKIVGFISAFCPPTEQSTVFVWQVAVDEAHRGKGLGMAMLKDLLGRKACEGVRFLEITVTPSNLPATNLYRKLAENLGTACEESTCFPAELFPGTGHEAEWMFRIGPFS